MVVSTFGPRKRVTTNSAPPQIHRDSPQPRNIAERRPSLASSDRSTSSNIRAAPYGPARSARRPSRRRAGQHRERRCDHRGTPRRRRSRRTRSPLLPDVQPNRTGRVDARQPAPPRSRNHQPDDRLPQRQVDVRRARPPRRRPLVLAIAYRQQRSHRPGRFELRRQLRASDHLAPPQRHPRTCRVRRSSLQSAARTHPQHAGSRHPQRLRRGQQPRPGLGSRAKSGVLQPSLAPPHPIRQGARHRCLSRAALGSPRDHRLARRPAEKVNPYRAAATCLPASFPLDRSLPNACTPT